jgi:hypothetical protein
MAYDLEPTTQPPLVPYQEDELVPGMSTILVEAQPERPVIDRFDVVLRGYERHQVDDHVMRMAASEAQVRAELQAAAEREAVLAAELAQTKAELERGRPTFDALGERVSQMLGLAETEAEQMRSDAARDTAELRETAAKDAADIRSDARRDAEELGAAARRELAVLKDERMAVLTDVSVIRDRLNDILGGTTEQWPSLAPAEETSSIDLTQPIPLTVGEPSEED